MTLFTTGDGNTPLSPEEADGLIPNLSTRQELNEWERRNILEAFTWALNPRTLHRPSNDPLAEPYIRNLHQRMFSQTWAWAGRYRITEKNIGVPHHRIRESLAVLLGDAQYWLTHQTWPPDEIAIRVHHRLVWIHPFPNGNGRHARLLADILIQRQKIPPFTWGRAGLAQTGDLRQTYIQALHAADQHDIKPLLHFARS